MVDNRGPRTTDVQRAKAAYRKACLALGADATPRQIKATFRLAKAAASVEREARRRADALLKRRPLTAQEPHGPSAGSSARQFRARLAHLSAIKERTHLDAERALRRDLEAAVALTGVPVRSRASLEALIDALVVDELLR